MAKDILHEADNKHILTHSPSSTTTAGHTATDLLDLATFAYRLANTHGEQNGLPVHCGNDGGGGSGGNGRAGASSVPRAIAPSISSARLSPCCLTLPQLFPLLVSRAMVHLPSEYSGAHGDLLLVRPGLLPLPWRGELHCRRRRRLRIACAWFNKESSPSHHRFTPNQCFLFFFRFFLCKGADFSIKKKFSKTNWHIEQGPIHFVLFHCPSLFQLNRASSLGTFIHSAGNLFTTHKSNWQGFKNRRKCSYSTAGLYWAA